MIRLSLMFSLPKPNNGYEEPTQANSVSLGLELGREPINGEVPGSTSGPDLERLTGNPLMEQFRLLNRTRQITDYSCGASALRSVLSYWGKDVDEEELMKLLRTSSDVGTYPEETKSGAGYFYDDVLEYRVWFHPEHGAIPFNGTNDYFMTFATYEPAEAVSKTLPGAEEPLVLIRQLESINEPEPGRYKHDRKPRITEWQVRWLQEVNAIRQAFSNSCNIPAPKETKPSARGPAATHHSEPAVFGGV